MNLTNDGKLACILLVEDEEVAATYLTDLLESMEVAGEIRLCRDGHDALEYVRNARLNKHGYCDPNIIFLDIHMPKMGGFEFLRRYEAEMHGQSETYIVSTMATLADDELDDVAEYRHLVQTFVEKPITESIISEVVQKYRLEHGITTPSNQRVN